MKNDIKLLDCTLREAPIDNLMWGERYIEQMLTGMGKAGINIIECGFLRNNPYISGSTSFKRVEDVKPYLRKKRDGTIYTVLVDYGRYDLDNLSYNDGSSIDLIRICFKKDEIDSVLQFAQDIKDKGYDVAIQHVDTMGYSDYEICKFIEKINSFCPFAYSIVDTFGAMYEEDMIHFCQIVDKMLNENIYLGFHAHNNLMLADANAQGFLKNMADKRKVIVDSSLFGCGRGAGNAHTELMSEYLNKGFSMNFDIDELLDLIDTIVANVKEKIDWGYNMPYFISGIYNAHSFNVKHLTKRHNIKSKDLRSIIEKLDDRQKKKYDYKLLEKLYVEHFDHHINDEDVLKDLSTALVGRKIILLAPGKSIIQEEIKIRTYIKDNDPIVIGVNNIIEGYKLNYIFYSGVHRYTLLQYYNLDEIGNPQIIVTSNIKQECETGEIIVDYKSLVKFGWINLDSAAILLLRLLLQCGIQEVYIAGFDGFKDNGRDFYKDVLDTGLEMKDRNENTKDNLEMLKDLRKQYPQFSLHFITDSVYKEVFNKEA